MIHILDCPHVSSQAKVEGKVRARELAEEERTSWILEQRDYEKRRSEFEAHRGSVNSIAW